MTVKKGVDKFSNTAVISNVDKASSVTKTVSANTSKNVSKPDTGDSSNIILWLILLATAGIATIAIVVYRRKTNG